MRSTAADRRKSSIVAEREIMRFAVPDTVTGLRPHALWHKHIHNVELDPMQCLKMAEMDLHRNTVDYSCRRTGKTFNKELYNLEQLATDSHQACGIVAPRMQQSLTNLNYMTDAIKRSPILKSFLLYDNGRVQMKDTGFQFVNLSSCAAFGIMSQIDGETLTIGDLEEVDDMPQDRLLSRFLPMLGSVRRPDVSGDPDKFKPSIRITGVFKGASVLQSLIDTGGYHTLPAVNVHLGVQMGMVDAAWAKSMQLQQSPEEYIRQFLCRNIRAQNWIWEEHILRANALGLEAGLQRAGPVPGQRYKRRGLIGLGYDHTGHGESPEASKSALVIVEVLGNWMTFPYVKLWPPGTSDATLQKDIVAIWDYFRPDYALGDAYGVGMMTGVNDDLFRRGLTEVNRETVAYCAAHKVSHFICWSTSRFGRNLEDALKNTNQLREWGTKAAYFHQDMDLETDAGWMLSVMTGMMDEVYSRNISRDTLRSQISSSRDGFFVGGRVPYGYMVEKVGKRSKLAPHPENSSVVGTMFGLALSEGLGSQSIALRMNAAGLLRNGKTWSKNAVTTILKNPSYMGERLFNQVRRKGREAKPAAEIVRVDCHPAIVRKEDFEKVQAMMKERTPHEVGGTPKSAFGFSGLLKCGICGTQLQIRNGTGRGGIVYSYYACLAHKNGKARCFLKSVKAEAFDVWMVNELLNRVLTTTVVQKVIDEIKAHGGKWAEERDVRRRTLVRALREAEGKRDKLYEVVESLGKNTPNLTATMERLNVLYENIKALEVSLNDLETREAPDYRLVDIDPQMAVETIQGVIRSCPDPKQLRMLMGTFVQQITVSNTSVVVDYREDALLRSAAPTVHSGVRWLLNLGSNQGPTD